MNKKIIIAGLALSITMMIASCVKDLDVNPKDPTKIMSGNLGDNPEYYQEVLGKIYASFMMSGQNPNYTQPDISAGDNEFFTTTRALWNLQEITTDESICAWGDVGISDLNTQTWSPSNPFLTALYQRLSLSITFANDFIGKTSGSSDANVQRYNAEARFLRALAYYYHIDLFGNPPFTTEADGVGKFYPKQLDPVPAVGRAKLFIYIVKELHDIETKLGDPGFSYPQADKGACWMLLARMYLNAQVYTGTAKWDSCKLYCDKVISSGVYSLNADYRHNFTADNDFYSNPEMIFAWSQDGLHSQGYVGTTFVIESCSDAVYLRAEDYHGLTGNTNWNGNRSRIQFMNILVDTLATYGGSPIPSSDPTFALCLDKRVYLKQKKAMNIPSSSSNGDYGIGVYKFTARNADGTLPLNYHPVFACTDFPIFRLADAYLMRAEALFNLNDKPNALLDVNIIRERAYGDPSGDITAGQLTAQFLLDERCREFYYEAQRRTDLIRFGKFTNGDYNWQWKGGTPLGINTDSHMNLFPIPGDEVSANPNIKQNPGY
jgi:hypothetical protein